MNSVLRFYILFYDSGLSSWRYLAASWPYLVKEFWHFQIFPSFVVSFFQNLPVRCPFLIFWTYSFTMATYNQFFFLAIACAQPKHDDEATSWWVVALKLEIQRWTLPTLDQEKQFRPSRVALEALLRQNLWWKLHCTIFTFPLVERWFLLRGMNYLYNMKVFWSKCLLLYMSVYIVSSKS